MKAFRVLGVEVVQSAIKLDIFDVVPGRMKFGNVEPIANLKVHENALVVMKALEGIFKKLASHRYVLDI